MDSESRKNAAIPYEKTSNVPIKVTPQIPCEHYADHLQAPHTSSAGDAHSLLKDMVL